MAFSFRTLRVEALEERTLLAADVFTALEVLDVRDIAAIYAPESVSSEAWALSMGDKWSALRSSFEQGTVNAKSAGYDVEQGRIMLSVMGTGTQEELLKNVTVLGLDPTFASDTVTVVDGYIALSDLHKLVEADGISAVIPYRPKQATDSVGSVNNDAELALRGVEIREFLGLTGSGVTVGVISNGVGGLTESQATNDLPPDFGTPNEDVTIRVLDAGNGNEGTAMLELIHDIAPMANLLFHSGIGSEAAFASAIDDLVTAGADIIVDDINGLFSESWFADGVAAESITDAIDAGVFVASSAGNRGDNAFESPARFVTNQNIFGNIGTFQDFSEASDFLQTVTITQDALPNTTPAAVDFQLQFDQLFGDVDSDVRLWAFTTSGTLITSSSQDNDTLNDPNDLIALAGTGTLQLAIELVDGPAPSRLRWTHFGDVTNIAHDTATDNIRTGRNPGHAATIGNVSAGTTDVDNPLVRRTYSGIGEVTRTLTPAGNPLANLEFRGGPTLMGVDGTNTSVDNLDSGGTPVSGWSDFTTFFGTSAAAPNVAAIAALLLEADPSLTPQGVRSALVDAARDIDATGIDLTSGAGVVDALGAIGIVQNTPQLVGLDPDEYIVVNDNRDLLDANTDPDVIDVDLVMPGEQVSLRSAIVNANTGGTETTLLVREDTYNLTLIDGEQSNASANDLDITGDVTIVGAGAGLSVIDASFGATVNNNTRVFEVSGANRSLTLDRLTVTGGDTTSAGGAAFVTGGGSLTVRNSAFVDNHAAQRAGAIRNMGGTLDVTDSVFTGNSSGFWGGAISSAESNGTVNLGRNVFAENTALAFANTELSNGSFTSEGLHLIDDINGSNGFFSLERGDRIETGIGTIDVVTSVADTFDHTDGVVALSLREAVDNANADDGTIWLPAWRLGLNRNGTELNTAEMNDLDITGDVTIAGIGAGLTVIDLNGLDDPAMTNQNRAFELRPGGSSLDLSHVTVEGGTTTATSAGSLAIIWADGELNLTDSAIVDHLATVAHGVAIRSVGGDVTIRRSVFTNNASTTTFSTGAVYVSSGGSITVGESVFALNTNVGTGSPNIAFSGLNSDDVVSLGNNLFDEDGTGANAFFTDPSDHTGTPDLVVTSLADQLQEPDDAYALSLREAVIEANNGVGMVEVWVPAWHYRLTRSGTENADNNDLDISGDVRIVGVGPGLTVIDAGGLDDPAFDTSNRAFQVMPNVNAVLELSHVTVMGGLTTGSSAGNGVFVSDGGTLDLVDSAIVNQTGMANGVAIRSMGGNVTIQRSVLTNNTSTDWSSGITSTGGGSLSIGESVFALNSGVTHDNVFADATVTSNSLGNNLYDNHNASGNAFSFDGTGDQMGTPDYVVTSVADTFEHANDIFSLSLREAVDLANNDPGASEIWLPAWDFVLTRDRETFGTGTTDMDTSFGDLDISDSLVVRGIQGETSVAWRAGVVDAVFDLLGDFDGDGINGDVDGSDFLTWQLQNGSGSVDPSNWGLFSADGDDDGDVDAADLAVWSANFGNTLGVIGVLV